MKNPLLPLHQLRHFQRTNRQLAKLDHKVRLVKLVASDHKGLWEKLEREVRKEKREHQGHKEPQVERDRKDKQDLREQ